MATYHAQPYDITGRGFYFTSLEEYQAKEKANRCEEFELQFIDGNTGDSELFERLKINQATLTTWFEEIEGMDEEHKAGLFFLVADRGASLADALEQCEDCILYQGSMSDYASEYLEESGILKSIPEDLRGYFDVEAYARDMEINGQAVGFEWNDKQWVGNPSA